MRRLPVHGWLCRGGVGAGIVLRAAATSQQTATANPAETADLYRQAAVYQFIADHPTLSPDDDPALAKQSLALSRAAADHTADQQRQRAQVDRTCRLDTVTAP